MVANQSMSEKEIVLFVHNMCIMTCISYTILANSNGMQKELSLIHDTCIHNLLIHRACTCKTVGPLVLAWINCALTRTATRKSFIVFGEGLKLP